MGVTQILLEWLMKARGRPCVPDNRVGRGAGAPGSRGAEKERPRRGRGAEQKSRGR